MYYMKPLKSPTHIHFLTKNFIDSRQVRIMILGFSPCFYEYTYTFFDEKFLWIRDSFFALWLWDFHHVLYAYYAERKFCHKYTHALSPVWNRPHIRALYARKISPQIYIRIAVRLKSVGDWLSVGIFAFVCITFCICGHRLDKVVFFDRLIDVKVWL